MSIFCLYDDTDTHLRGYKGFGYSQENIKVTKLFKTDNPPQDFRDASAYGQEKDTWCTMSSSVDHFVSDCGGVFEWYTDEFGNEWFDYAEKVVELKAQVEQKLEEAKFAFTAYFKHSLGIGDDPALAFARETYNNIGTDIQPYIMAYVKHHNLLP